MKKSLLVLLVAASSLASAKHYFNICYYNWSKSPVTYNNEGITHKWKDRGTLVGSGTIMPEQNKCFQASDETMFITHYITFYVNNTWFGATDPGFTKPYAIAQQATATKGGKLANHVDNAGHDQYNLNVHIMSNGENILSASNDPKDSDDIITPRLFK